MLHLPLLRRHLQQQASSPGRDIRNVLALTQALRNLPTRLNLPELDKGVSSLVDRCRDGLRSLGFTFSTDDGRLTFLLGLLNNELCPFGVLLGDLLLLDGGGELLSECHVGLGSALVRRR